MGAARGRVRPLHLIRRGGTFHLRVRVPADISARVGTVEVRRSLMVGRLSEARLLAPIYSVRIKEAFVMIRAEALTRDQSVALINRCFRDLLMETDKPYTLSTAEPDMEIREQRTASEDRLFYLERQVTAGRAEPTTGEWLRTYLAERGVELPSGSAGHSDLLALGLLRAMAEQQRAFQYRLEEAVLPFVPIDPLFVTPDDQDRRRQADIEATAVGPTMAQLADKYLTARRSQWTVKTYKLNEQKLGFVVEFLGSTRRASPWMWPTKRC